LWKYSTSEEKKRKAIGKDSSSLKELRYSERMFIFMFLLVVARIFSQVSTKCGKQVEQLLE
jgi:hypothetical protein